MADYATLLGEPPRVLGRQVFLELDAGRTSTDMNQPENPCRFGDVWVQVSPAWHHASPSNMCDGDPTDQQAEERRRSERARGCIGNL